MSRSVRLTQDQDLSAYLDPVATNDGSYPLISRLSREIEREHIAVIVRATGFGAMAQSIEGMSVIE
jgi:hypothetical protein